MTPEELDARATAAVSFDFDAALPSCDHPERGHAPVCHDCKRAALQEEIANRKPTFATHGRQDVCALVAEVRRLRAILEGRTTAPTSAEIEAHIAAGGAWVAAMQGHAILAETVGETEEIFEEVEYFWPDDYEDDDSKPPENTWRWWPLDRERRPCAWPVVSG